MIFITDKVKCNTKF